MKKSLLALALLGAFGAASAQSSVTLYGIADVNLQSSDPKAGTTSNPERTTGVSSGYQAGSRLGVRGTEALGGGLNAVFTLEMGYNIDQGTRGQGTSATTVTTPTGSLSIPAVDRLFGRQAWAGLSGGFGTLVAGRIPTFSSGTGSFDMFGQVDPFDTGWGILGVNNSMSSANALRLDNTVAYVTPSSLGGFKAGVAYSFNAIGSEGPKAGGVDPNVKVIGVGASFGAGPFYGVVTYDSVDYPTPVQSDKQTHLQVGGTFDLQVVKLHAGYAQEEKLVALDVGKVGVGGDADAWMVGATVPFGATQLRASYQVRNADALGATPKGEKKTYGIGIRHALSNRTFLAVGYGDQKLQGSLKTGSNGGVKEFTVGVRHNF